MSKTSPAPLGKPERCHPGRRATHVTRHATAEFGQGRSSSSGSEGRNRVRPVPWAHRGASLFGGSSGSLFLFCFLSAFSNFTFLFFFFGILFIFVYSEFYFVLFLPSVFGVAESFVVVPSCFSFWALRKGI